MASSLFHDRRQTPPQTDLASLALFILVLGSIISWAWQRQRWQRVADRLIEASVEGWSIHSGGGTPESVEIQKHALLILAEMKEDEDRNTRKPSKNSKKLTTQEKKKLEKDKLRRVVQSLVNEMNDFGGGYHQPSWKDILLVKLLLLWPFQLLQWARFELRCRYLLSTKRELCWENMELLAKRTVGRHTWGFFTPAEKEEMISSRIWESQGQYNRWQERHEFRYATASEKKRYSQMSNGDHRPRGRASRFYVPDHGILKTRAALCSSYKPISNRAVAKLKKLIPFEALFDWHSTQDFVRAAEYIREHNIAFPSDLIDDLRTAIHLRTMAGIAHGELSSPRGKNQPKHFGRQGHQHFIHVLQQCLDILRSPHVQPKQ